MYCKIYFSVLKKINLLSSEENLQIFDFLIKGMSILLKYGYTDEARQIYQKTGQFIKKMNLDEQLSCSKILSLKFGLRFSTYSDVDDFFNKTYGMYQEYSQELFIIYAIGRNEKGVFDTYVESLGNYILEYMGYLFKEREVLKLQEKYKLTEKIIKDFDCLVRKISERIPLSSELMTCRDVIKFLYWIYLDMIGKPHPEGDKLLTIEKLWLMIEFIERHCGETSILYLNALSSGYRIFKSQNSYDTETIRSLEEEIKRVYHMGHFENFKYEYVEKIVTELKLEHSGIDSLEDE